MKYLLFFLLCFSCLAQLPGGLRSPATLGQYNGFTQDEVLALGPTFWVMGDEEVTPGTDGSKTSVWGDQSANGFDLIRTNNVAQQPYWQDNVINGHGAMMFYATNTMSMTNHFPVTYEVPLEFFIVGCGTNAQPYGSGYLFSGVESHADSYQCLMDGAKITFRDQSGSVGDFRDYQSNKWVVGHFAVSTNFARIRTFDRTHNVDIGTVTMGMRGFLLGYNSATSTGYFNGWIAELIFFTKQLNEHQAQGVSKYLCKKYNLPINN